MFVTNDRAPADACLWRGLPRQLPVKSRGQGRTSEPVMGQRIATLHVGNRCGNEIMKTTLAESQNHMFGVLISR